MTVSLGGISLDEGLRLEGVGNQPQVAASVRKTLGGRPVVQSIPVAAGRELLLEAYRGGESIRGYFTGSQFSALAALRDAAQAVTLVHHLGTFRVRILSLQLETVSGVSDPDGSTIYIGTITMIEV